MSTFRSRTAAAVVGISTVALVVPMAAAAIPHTQTPVDTDATDGVIARESFNDLTLDRVSQDPGVLNMDPAFTHTPPAGWAVDFHDSMADQGVEDWRGWTFTTKDHWVDAEDQMRDRFTRADDIIAVIDPDEYDDAATTDHTYEADLTTAPVPVAGRDQVVFSFDSHYRSYENQNATVTVSFDGGPAQEILAYSPETLVDDYDERVINAHESLLVDVPAGAQEATFAFHYASDPNSWYWAIDSVTVREALPEQPADEATTAWIVSDIQGHPRDLQEGLTDLHTLRPDPNALLMVGDIVDTGAPAEWDDIYTVMANTADIRPEQTIAAIGNHESYTGEPFETPRGRFLEFAERDEVYAEYLIEGAGVDVPVIVLGQEEQRPPEVSMSEEQLNMLDERLDHWSEQGRQVLVLSHFPLGETTSGTFRPEYSNHHEHNDLLTEIMGDHPNAVWIAGHTHYPARAGDWSMQKRVAGGHPDGFWNVNTISMHVGWDVAGEDTATSTEVTTGDDNYGMTLDAHADRLIFRLYDFGATAEGNADEVLEQVRELTIPNPLAGSTATEPGEPGRVVVESVEINEDGDFVVAYTDGTRDVLTGPTDGGTGRPGQDGADGSDGQDGESLTIVDTSVDEEGNTTVIFSDGTSFVIPAGQDGRDATGSSVPGSSTAGSSGAAGPLAAVIAVLAAVGGAAWAALNVLPNLR